jgi:hypothetical protein
MFDGRAHFTAEPSLALRLRQGLVVNMAHQNILYLLAARLYESCSGLRIGP